MQVNLIRFFTIFLSISLSPTASFAQGTNTSSTSSNCTIYVHEEYFTGSPKDYSEKKPTAPTKKECARIADTYRKARASHVKKKKVSYIWSGH